MNEASRLQVDAAHPESSTWLSANAGSGKTRVLTDRVARLLLGRTSPQNILCLTYTKAAASEMQNRLFRRLGVWAMLPDAELARQLSELGATGTRDAARLAEARRLFARAIETPGGLRIQTIHSFCAALLRRFPLEAGVSPQFEEMDERAAAQIRSDCLEDVALRDPEAMAGLAFHHGGIDLDQLVAEIAKARDGFARPFDADALRRTLGLADIAEEDAVLRRAFTGGEAALLGTLAEALAHGSTTDLRAHADIAALSPPWTLRHLETLERWLLTGSGAGAPFTAKIGKFPTKATRDRLGDALDDLDALMGRVEAAREARLGLAAFERSRALHLFARAYLPLYAARKTARGWLDFDDLIFRARDLLTARDVADWVLYRLDGGIDHILVDEAQDTSPAQWQVIEALAQELVAGGDAADGRIRTIFVVGDKKQSIYSFQGADPEGFDRMHDRFSEARGDGWLRRREMRHSFRSSAAILDTVDSVFAAAGGGLGPDVAHVAFHDRMPGRVDLWPVEAEEPGDDAPDFHDPVDIVTPSDARVRLARKVATAIAAMIAAGETIPDGDGRRPITEGDILILLRSRGPLFHEVVRSCKAAGLNIAGADRLKLGRVLAVRDVRALLAFLVTPEDDLSLATTLRSPLFGWTEGQLFDLARDRGQGYLWQALRARRDAFPETLAALDDLRAAADYLRPYDLIERILTRHRGRERLLGRLGAEAQDPLDRLLDEALRFEAIEIPSLTGFLAWFDADDVEIKRQSDGSGRELRVMTIHGAKGLEAPIVILPDTMSTRAEIRQEIVPAEDGVLLWKQQAAQQPRAMAAAIDRIRAADAAERARLLYVAMTRAEHWLVVCGAGDPQKTDGTWYGDVEAGLARLATCEPETPWGRIRRHEAHEWSAGKLRTQPPIPAAETELPAWFGTPAPVPAPAPGLLSPSSLGGAKALPGEIAEEDEEAALRRGRRLHLLLETLDPDAPETWPATAGRLSARDGSTPEEGAALLREAGAVLSAPDLREVMRLPALLEVGVTAPGPDGRQILGTIDRLIVTHDRVLAIDYKSNRTVPTHETGVPDGLLRQMGAYAVALGALYPGARIETALLWTANARLMRLPTDRVVAAFRAALSA